MPKKRIEEVTDGNLVDPRLNKQKRHCGDGFFYFREGWLISVGTPEGELPAENGNHSHQVVNAASMIMDAFTHEMSISVMSMMNKFSASVLTIT